MPRLLALAFAAVVTAAACGRPSQVPARDLVFWTTPIDAPADSAAPTVAEQGEFFDHLPQYFQKKYRERLSPRIRVTDVRGKTRDDSEFARQVLGQHLFLRELSQFIDRQSGTRAIEVKFLKWEELFGALDDLNGEAESAPEVTIVPSSWVAALADSALAPLDRPPYAVNTSGFAERALETCRTSNGTLYALPWMIDVRFFFYWKDLFPPDASFENRAQFGRALDGSSRLQLARAGDAFKPPFVFPTEVDWDILHMFSLFVWNSGGDWRARRAGWRDGGLAVLTADDGANAVAAIKELAATNSMAFLQVKRNDLEGRFVAEDVASVLAGPWLIRRLQEKYSNPGEWYVHVGVTLPPFNESGTPTTFLGGSHLGVTRKAARDTLALNLIEYITTQAAARTAPDNLTIPAADQARKALLASFPPDSPMRTLIPEAIEHSRSYPPVAEWPRAVEVELSHVRLPLLFTHVAEKESAAAVARDLAEIRHTLLWGVLIAPILWPALPLGVATIVASAGTLLFLVWRRAKKREFDEVQRHLEIREQEMRVSVQQAKRALSDKEREMDALNETRRALESSLRESEVAIRVLEERARQNPSDPLSARMRDLESARFDFERKLESIETVMKAEREALVDLARSAGSLAAPSGNDAAPPSLLSVSPLPQGANGPWLFPTLSDVLEHAARQERRRA